LSARIKKALDISAFALIARAPTGTAATAVMLNPQTLAASNVASATLSSVLANLLFITAPSPFLGGLPTHGVFADLNDEA
jgi:hypothetical protein